MKLSVTTLGWPSSPLEKILGDIQSAGGFAGVDFRGLGDELNITRLEAFNDGLDKTLEQIKAAGLVISGLSTSTRLVADAKGDRKADEAVAYCELADRIGVPYIRIFGGRRRDGQGRQQWMDEAVANLRQTLEATDGRKAQLCLETHDDWCHSADVAELMDKVSHPRAAVLWDMLITALEGKETPAQSADNIGKLVRYTHIKDGYTDGEKIVLTLPGEGKVDVAGAVGQLKRLGYDGWLTFEWEQRWHPDLPDAAEALPAYRKLLEPLI